MPEFRIKSGSLADRFIQCRSKIQIYGGGYANGKTATACFRALVLAKDYPGSNGLIARASYPKLEDTIKREFFKWFPPEWKKSFNEKFNTLTLINGSTINFRYVQQKGVNQASQTSNLLSATYDWIVVDQMDDPEFQHKDYTDLLGRLRGTTKYTGSDASMPTSGPRWIIITLNPTRNWIFKQLVKPILDYRENGYMSPDLIRIKTEYRTDDLDELIQVFSGSTYENQHNLTEDYMLSLKAMYSGVQQSRYLQGEWGAYSGLVYPMFDHQIHQVNEEQVMAWRARVKPSRILEMYDHGLRNPSCYMLAIVDHKNNHVVVDGYKAAEQSPEDIIKRIKDIRYDWSIPRDAPNAIWSDPAIFRRQAGEFKTVGKSVADIFSQNGTGLHMVRGNNDIQSGIIKVGSYLTPHTTHYNPFDNIRPAPFLYFNYDRVQFIEEEISDYFYKEPDSDEGEDRPVDGNDHALDALKYGLTGTPDVVNFIPKKKFDVANLTRWMEHSDNRQSSSRSGRYGYR